MTSPFRVAAAAVAALALALTGCTASPSATPGASQPASTEITLVTHESFNVTQTLLDKFTADTGYTVKISKLADAGAMTNQLVLTKDAPLGDVVFGIDNTFAGRAISEGVLQPYATTKLPADSADLKADDSNALTPIDYGDVCVNADKAWFADKKLALPTTLDDLTKPEYKGLLVTEHAASSSPGLAFLAATVGAKGADGYLDYWGRLKANDVKVVKGWTEAYYTEFSAGEGKGPKPLVVSYSTSPASHVNDAKTESVTVALLETCFRQVEYAGVIKGAKNEAGAQAFIDFLLSPEVQADIPGQMYMYPAVKATPLPAEWQKFAPLAPKPFTVPADQLSANRERWVTAWTAKVVG